MIEMIIPILNTIKKFHKNVKHLDQILYILKLEIF